MMSAVDGRRRWLPENQVPLFVQSLVGFLFVNIELLPGFNVKQPEYSNISYLQLWSPI
jgi:hypothetical protein